MVGGGTGGHLFPAIALAETFMKKDLENKIQFVVTQRALDAQILKERGYSFKTLKIEGIKGKGLAGKARSLFLLPKALGRSLKMIGEFRPDLVLGVGGYVSGPVVLAAWLKGIPCAIQEQNSIPGMTNRLLGKVVDRVFGAFEECRSYFVKSKLRITGNPIRKEIRVNTKIKFGVNSSEFGDDHFHPSLRPPAAGMRISSETKAPSGSPVTVLILGGSQGAHRINQALVDSLDDLVSLKKDLAFIHQTGEKDAPLVARAYEEKGFEHQVLPFIADMAGAYRQADMIIGRAGAMTVSEIMAVGKPSLLIPFPFAANNHQETNARSLVTAGAAEMIIEKDLAPGLLADRIKGWVGNREKLVHMGQKAAGLGRPQAAETIVDLCYEIIDEKKGSKVQ